MLIVGVCGSSAPSRRTRALIECALEGAVEAANGVETQLIDLAMVRLDFADGRPVDGYSDATRAVLDVIRRGDAYLFGSPMYRGSMTGALKNLIDLIPKEDVQGKAAGLIATGASAHHYLGLELGLRAALAFFQVHTVPGILYASNFELLDGRPADPTVREQARGLGRDVVHLARATRGIALGPALF